MKRLLLAVLSAVLLPALSAGQMLQQRSQTVVSAPAASALATASVPAADNVKHVADTICFAGGSTTAPALTALTVNLRDGATTAGTVLATWTVIIPNATGQNVAPFCSPELEIAGSNATAMTLEFSSLLTNELESVTLMYHNTAN
jgi:hypothetical protein